MASDFHGNECAQQALSRICEIEEYYQTLAAEVDERSLSLSSTEFLAKCGSAESQESDKNRNYNSIVYATRDAWQWTLEAARCMQIHLAHAARYHQFFSEVKHYGQCLSQVTSRLYRPDGTSPGKMQNASNLCKQIKELLQMMLDIEAKVIGLFSQSGDIVPVHLRRESVKAPIKIIALVTCTNKEIPVFISEECELLDNCEVTKWKVRNSRGQEGYLPAIIFLIPPPDREAILKSFQLRQDLMTAWKESLQTAKLLSKQLISKYFAENDPDELCALNQSQRSDVAHCIEDLSAYLAPSKQNRPGDEDFRDALESWHRTVEDMQGPPPAGMRNKSGPLLTVWSGHKKLFRQLQEYETYAVAYEESVVSSRQTQNFLVRDENGAAKYVSKAYIERLRPVELEPERDDDGTRHLTLAEKVPSIPESYEDDHLSHTSVLTDVSFDEETMSLQTIKETQTFVIKGVIDPRDNQEISIYQAISDGIINQTKGIYFDPNTGTEMPIPEAMNRGLILVEFTDKTLETGDLIKSGVIRSTTTTETVSYSVQSVVDPVTGQRITVVEAIERGIIDQESGKYVNPLTGSVMSMSAAIDRGLVDVEEVCEQATVSPKEAAIPELNPALAVVGVKDPNTGRPLSLQDAIDRGIIDVEKGLYRTPNGAIPIAEAVKQGLMQVKLASDDESEDNLLPLAVRKDIHVADLEEFILPEGTDCVDSAKDLNQAVFEKLEMDKGVGGIHDPSSGRSMTIGEAFDEGLLHVDTLHLEGVDGEKFPLQEAALQGLVEPHTLREILGTLDPLAIENLMEDSIIDANTGEYVDPKTGERMSLAEAIEQGRLDPDQVFLRDLVSGAIMSLSAAIENKKINPETGKVIDPVTGQEMSFATAIGNHVIDPAIDADKLAAQISALKFLNEHLDVKQKGVMNPLSGSMSTLEEAVLNGSLDIPNGSYVNTTTDEASTLAEAVNEKLMNPQVAKEILNAMNENSLGALIDKGIIDPNTGKFIDPVTGKKMSLKEAIDKGLLDPCSVFVVDPETGQVTSLDSLIKDGRFNPVSGKFKDPLTGLEVSLNNAIKKGILTPRIDPERMIEEKVPVKDILANSKLNPADLIFQAPDGSTLPLKTALGAGFLTPDSIVKIDPKTGVLTVAGDPELTNALMGTKKTSDWLTGIESMLAGDDTPLQSAEDLDKEITGLENLKTSLDQRQPSVDALLDKAKGLLENNKNAEVDAGTQQQCQRLRFNSSDLKVRMDTSIRVLQQTFIIFVHCLWVNTHLDRKVDQLKNMHKDLDNLYENLEAFEGWMDTADEEMKIFKTTMAEGERPDLVTRSFQSFLMTLRYICMMYERNHIIRFLIKTFQHNAGCVVSGSHDPCPVYLDFNEGVLSKEGDLKGLNKASRKLQDIVQDHDKDAASFRRTLPNKPEFQKDGGTGLKDPVVAIQKEVEATNERYKDVLTDCSALMGRLNETAAKNKQYQQLRDQLQAALPQLQKAVESCTDAAGSDPERQLEELKGVTADVIAAGKVMEDLRKVGENLVEILEELDCKETPKAVEIQSSVDGLQAVFDEVQEEVVDKQHRLNSAVAQSKDVGHNLAALLEWVDEMDGTFSSMKPVSLNREALTQQIQEHKLLSSDIDNHHPQVDTVVEQCQDQGLQDDRVNELLDRFDRLIGLTEERGTELEEVVQKLGNLHGNVHQLESWLGGAVHSLKRESSDFDHDSLKTKIENLYQHKQTKQKDLDNIKNVGKELIDDPRTGDKHQLREVLADVQGKWHDLTELLVQMISFAALREIDDLLKYLDKAENEINTAEPISTDPETLAVQLRDHRVFHEDLEAKRTAVNATIDKCNRMLRETTNEEADDIKNKLDTIRNQADLVCKLSSERLAVLEEALPLASHFREVRVKHKRRYGCLLDESETQADLQSWLGEIEAEVDSLNVPTESNVEQVKKQQDHAKTTQRIIEDHKHLVEDLLNTGDELMELCTDEDASDIKEDMDHIKAKHEAVKSAIRHKLNQLDDTFRNMSSDVNDTVDGLLEELHYLHDQTEHADPIAANPDALKNQIADNRTILDDLERKEDALQHVKEEVARALELESPETLQECEDLRAKIQDLDKMHNEIKDATTQRENSLQGALAVAEKFRRDYQDAMQSLRDIQDNLASQDSPGVDPATVFEQQKELQSILEELQAARQPVAECQSMSEILGQKCGEPGNMEIERQVEDVTNLLEEIQDGVGDREEELASAMDKAERFDDVLQAINSWLPKAEAKMEKMSPVAADPRSVRIQIEELKVFKIQTHPRYIDVQNLNQFASDLKNASPVTAESLTPQVKDINGRWNDLLTNMAERETSLKHALVELGELDHSVEEVLGLLQQTESDIQQLEFVYGDPKYIETHLRKIQMVLKDLQNQEPVIKKLCAAIDQHADRSGSPTSPLVAKKADMLESFKIVQVMARDKQNELHDILKEVKAFMGEVEDGLRWLNDFRDQLKSSAPMGALPDTAQKEYDTFMAQYHALEKCEEAVKTLLLNGEDMLARCREDDGRQLRENLRKLQTRCYDTRNKAEKRRRKLEQHLQNVQDFHAMLTVHTDWLSNAERILASFKYPSKLVEKDFKVDIDGHREIMQNLDKTGTYLKYFGRKQDTVYIKNLLISIKLRWKKLVRRTDEKGRLLQQAYKEDKRFDDAWRGLFDWLDVNEKKMMKFASQPAKVKQDIDELRNFQHELGSKHPVYYSTMRLGRALKDRCVKSDHERDVMNTMLEDLKNKWSVIRSIVSQREGKNTTHPKKWKDYIIIGALKPLIFMRLFALLHTSTCVITVRISVFVNFKFDLVTFMNSVL
ncbi:hypothetical protein CAPTEDRAFT_205084 [Capitella teleta]|uniref:Desmoplakin SH3 domain-containing protein n=1 Tax=Capitella teleta TaxID=283909 RepID=R7T9B7_CAPTE|nr:hypothetical protein CAPTEDRAFT_205084 [Capitella teleta]|eukprot:ELT90303.1 hypothetical protein CAPTEDRAFT_205084 [Capitella teleta]